nr:PPOX class F420-dependent oxidoreductase [Rhodococcus opacus]
MAASRKFRNVADNGKVAFVVDDVPSVDPWRVRCVEIRGRAEALDAEAAQANDLGGPTIRIHPERIISFGLGATDQGRPSTRVERPRRVRRKLGGVASDDAFDAFEVGRSHSVVRGPTPRNAVTRRPFHQHFGCCLTCRNDSMHRGRHGGSPRCRTLGPRTRCRTLGPGDGGIRCDVGRVGGAAVRPFPPARDDRAAARLVTTACRVHQRLSVELAVRGPRGVHRQLSSRHETDRGVHGADL